jgi:hypothetical protein
VFKFLSLFGYYFSVHGLLVTHFSVNMSHFLSVVCIITAFNIAGLEFAMSVWMMMKICGLYRCVAEPSGTAAQPYSGTAVQRHSGTAVYPRRNVFCRQFIFTIFVIGDGLVTNQMRDISSKL